MVRLISGSDLRQKIDQDRDLKLVFVLGEWQYRAMRIPGSLNLPCTPSLYSSDADLRGLDRDDEIVVYCSSEDCYASVSVYHLLTQRGYANVSRYAGGLVEWYSAGYPMDGEMKLAPTGSRAPA